MARPEWSLSDFEISQYIGEDKFGKVSTSLARSRIIKVDLMFPSTHYVSAEAKDLISKLLVKDSSTRLSLEDIMKHPWTVKNVDP